jgi:hypothetical protein
VVGVVGLTLFFSYWVRFMNKHHSLVPGAQIFSYEMPRPKNFEPPFDLSDAEVIRRYQTLPALPAKSAAPIPVKAKVDPKKAAADKAAAAKKEAAQKAAAAKAAAAARKKNVSVEVVDTQVAPTLTVETIADVQTAPATAYVGSIETAQSPAAADEDAAEDKEEDLNLSAAQWRSLLQTNPTAQNVSKFIRAKQSGKLDSNTYYQIVHELLVDSAEDRRKAALAILDADVSAPTFVFMVTQLQQAPAEAQTALKSRIDSYSDAAKIFVLARVMNSSSETAVLEAATSRVAAALAIFKNSTMNTAQGHSSQTNGTKTVRAMAGAGLTVQHFASFIPSLQRLSKNADGTVSSRASQLLTDIQNLLKSKGRELART